MKIYTFYSTDPFVVHAIPIRLKQVIELMYPSMFYGYFPINLIRAYIYA